MQNAALTFSLSEGKVTVPPRYDVATIANTLGGLMAILLPSGMRVT